MGAAARLTDPARRGLKSAAQVRMVIRAEHLPTAQARMVIRAEHLPAAQVRMVIRVEHLP
jgi:hypothetical protein